MSQTQNYKSYKLNKHTSKGHKAFIKIIEMEFLIPNEAERRVVQAYCKINTIK